MNKKVDVKSRRWIPRSSITSALVKGEDMQPYFVC